MSLLLLFQGTPAAYVEIWSNAATNASVWYTLNPPAAVWDSGTAHWDLVGNTYEAVWDGANDTTYSDATTNAVTWSDA